MTTKKLIIIDKEIESIIPQFLKNRENDLIDLKRLIVEKDFPAIESIGHKLSGNAGGYGFTELGEIGRELETAAQEKDISTATKQINSIENYLNTIEVKYE